MSAATPTKRRALGALDVNVTRSPSSSSAKLLGKSASPLKKTRVSRHATPSPVRKETPKKRSFEEAEVSSPAFKKLCSATAFNASPVKDTEVVAKPKPFVEDAEGDSPPASQPSARRSISPDASSLFDSSTINISQLTNITEPDANAPIATTAAANTATVAAAVPPMSVTTSDMLSLPPPRPRRVPTREEFRQKAEILKLRLSLATYKVKTNQTDVPLDKLQIRPVPGTTQRRSTPLPSMSAHTVQRATPAQYWYRSLPSSQVVLDKDSDEESVVEQAQEQEQAQGEVVGQSVLPRGRVLVTPPRVRTVDEEARLTSSALRGGAAKGLLSLSQASS
ncbi:hypothetical protein N0V82_005752 [Gnomoniopsis sp. IMI 355080]|nr:hypothetical protein N0V82_005752 [Gnomoniopsis sp. IMI 355080]